MDEIEEDTGLSLLRNEWQGIQKKTFTKWCNAKLKPAYAEIQDLFMDFRDGKNLSLLLQTISGEALPKPERGNMRLHKVTNVSKSLDFVQRKGVKLVGVGAEEIVDGNEKMTLGMIWTIILRFALHGVGDSSMSARDGLLLWCQAKTKPYDNVSIQNFSKSWSNGLAFCALIHRHRPDLIEYSKLTSDDPKSNLELAFFTAETYLDIPRLLDSEDLVNVIPDEKSVMTYVSLYYQAFASTHESQTAVKRLADNLNLLADIDSKKQEYENLSSEILDWIKKTTEELCDRTVENDDLDCYKKMYSELDHFHGQVKPKWEDEKSKLENAQKTLRTLHKINDLPEYTPPDNLSIKEINNKWSELEGEDRKRLKWIKENICKQKKIDHLYKKFIHKCNMHETFANDTRSELSIENLTDDFSSLIASQRKYIALSQDITSWDNRLPQIDQIYNQLHELQFSRMSEVNERYDSIKNDWADIKSLSDRYASELNKKLKTAEDLDIKRVNFVMDAASLNSKMEYIIDEAGDAYIVNSLADVRSHIDQHNILKDSISPLEKQFEEILALDKSILEISTDKNPYTRITSEYLSRNLENIQSLIKSKDESLTSDMNKFEKHSSIEQMLNKIIEEIDMFQNETMDKLNMIDDGSLEEQKSSLLRLDEEIHEFYEPRLPELSKLISDINEAGVDTDVVPLSTLKSGFHKLSNMISSNINVIENSILLRDSSSISEDLIMEYKKIFTDLDRLKLGYLTPDEFRNFLVATGHKVTPGDATGDRNFDEIMTEVDPDDSKQVTFDSFLNYVAEKTKKKTNSEDMIDAFKVIAEGKPYITAEQLRRELPDHAERCILSLAQYSGDGAVPGALDYMSFTADLYGSSDL